MSEGVDQGVLQHTEEACGVAATLPSANQCSRCPAGCHACRRRAPLEARKRLRGQRARFEPYVQTEGKGGGRMPPVHLDGNGVHCLQQNKNQRECRGVYELGNTSSNTFSRLVGREPAPKRAHFRACTATVSECHKMYLTNVPRNWVRLSGTMAITTDTTAVIK